MGPPRLSLDAFGLVRKREKTAPRRISSLPTFFGTRLSLYSRLRCRCLGILLLLQISLLLPEFALDVVHKGPQQKIMKHAGTRNVFITK